MAVKALKGILEAFRMDADPFSKSTLKRPFAVIDTNFLIYAVKYRLVGTLAGQLVDIADGPVTIVVPSPVIRELENSKLVEAKVALESLKGMKHEVFESSLQADDAIVEFAAKNGGFVCTQDKRLKERLPENCRVVALRGKAIVRMV